jgi:hypothetical protein
MFGSTSQRYLRLETCKRRQHKKRVLNCLQSAVVSVAQPVEHRSVEPRVAGSNPVAHPKPFNHLRRIRSLGFLVTLVNVDTFWSKNRR